MCIDDANITRAIVRSANNVVRAIDATTTMLATEFNKCNYVMQHY
jgi:hypothetical protein